MFASCEPGENQSQKEQTPDHNFEHRASEPPVVALAEKEAVAAEAPAQRRNHSLATALWDRHLGGNGVVLVQNAGSIADGNTGILTRVSEDSFPGDRARSRR